MKIYSAADFSSVLLCCDFIVVPSEKTGRDTQYFTMFYCQKENSKKWSKIRKALHPPYTFLHSAQRNDEIVVEIDSNTPNIRKCKIHSDSSFDLAGNVG